MLYRPAIRINFCIFVRPDPSCRFLFGRSNLNWLLFCPRLIVDTNWLLSWFPAGTIFLWWWGINLTGRPCTPGGSFPWWPGPAVDRWRVSCRLNGGFTCSRRVPPWTPRRPRGAWTFCVILCFRSCSWSCPCWQQPRSHPGLRPIERVPTLRFSFFAGGECCPWKT